MNIREETERQEKQMLSPYAACAADSKGRPRPEAPCEMRTVYQRDRDRIIHCNAFRRLMHKTQVFLAPEGDHYRTRLTHTLEVAQIAKTLARALRLNEDLTEAIALAHDLVHTPFGHAGERTLSAVAPFAYKHAEQSVRVAQVLEKEGRGLNLSAEVVDGILHHTSGQWANTQEGQIVRHSDKIAYLNSDLEDAERAGVLKQSDLPYDVQYVLGRTKSERITTLLRSLVAHSGAEIHMGPTEEEAFQKMRTFMFETVYTNPVAKSEEIKAERILAELYEYYIRHLEELPLLYKGIAEQEGKERAVCDYISGMSDRYCVHTFQDLFVPRSWKVL